MSKVVLNVKTDEAVKRDAQNIARDIGVPISTVVNAYLKEFIRTRSVTFSAEPRLRPHIIKMFENAEREPLAKSKRFESMKDAVAFLNSNRT